jgi:hypothetical protein
MQIHANTIGVAWMFPATTKAMSGKSWQKMQNKLNNTKL